MQHFRGMAARMERKARRIEKRLRLDRAEGQQMSREDRINLAREIGRLRLRSREIRYLN